MGAFATEIVIWHAFDGFLEEKFTEIIEEFSAQAGNLQVKLVRKKDFRAVYEEGIEAQKEGKGPHILQVYEVATLSMMLKEKTYIPVGELMKKYHHNFDPALFMDIVRKYYAAPNGEILSFPWTVSTGVLFYNKKAFKEAGLDPEVPPTTWPEFERMAQKLKEKGYIGFTTAWPAAYHLEHVSCWHDLPYATHQNGFGGLASRLIFDKGPVLFHVKKLVQWNQKGFFSYSGRVWVKPERRFISGECAILFQGGNRFSLLKREADFEIGVGYLPYWPHLIEKPANLNIGGSSFWVLKGFSDEEYSEVVKLFCYLTSVAVQAEWHEATGYLPITDLAYYLTKKKGFYKDHPAAEITIQEVMKNRPTDHSYGMRFGDYVKIRNNIIDHLEKILAGTETPEEGLRQAAEEGNALLEQFEKCHEIKAQPPERPTHSPLGSQSLSLEKTGDGLQKK
jgi:sn-glycerol 3-phosphate transport system substrate-binding protein